MPIFIHWFEGALVYPCEALCIRVEETSRRCLEHAGSESAAACSSILDSQSRVTGRGNDATNANSPDALVDKPRKADIESVHDFLFAVGEGRSVTTSL